MDFGVSFPIWNPQPLQPLSIEAQAAIDSAAATVSTAHATWWAVGISGLALLFTGAAAYFTWKSLTTWRNQTLGEKEFNALIETARALHDIKASVHNLRLPVVFEGQATDAERSLEFREQLGRSEIDLLRASIGLDIVWGEEFKNLRSEVTSELRRLARASRLVYEPGAQGVMKKDYHLLNRLAPRQVTHPHLFAGEVMIEPAEQEIEKAKLMQESDGKFLALEEWIGKRLGLYSR